MIATTTAPDFLERAVDMPALEAIVAAESEQLERLRAIAAEAPSAEEVKARADVGRALGRLALHLGWSGRFEEAVALQQEALTLWEGLGRARAAGLARVRLALLEVGAGEVEGALARLDGVARDIEEDERLGVYADFVAKAQARAWARVGARREALEAIDRALALRVARGSARHVASTQALRALVEARVEAPAGD